MTTEKMVPANSASEVVEILSTIYSKHNVYSLKADNALLGFIRLHWILNMQDDERLSREEFTPLWTKWATAKTTEHAAVFEILNEAWLLHAFSKTQEGLDKMIQILDEGDLLIPHEVWDINGQMKLDD